MITALSVLDVIVSIALIGAVLAQSGKGSGLSDAFGGGGGYFGKGNDMDDGKSYYRFRHFVCPYYFGNCQIKHVIL